jgi:hypothetical protein
MLERFGLLDSKPVKTPGAVNFKRDCFSLGDRLTDDDARLYQSFVGWVMYAMIVTRPDLVQVIVEIFKPFKQHLITAKRVLGYAQFTKDFHLNFGFIFKFNSRLRDESDRILAVYN